MATTKSVFKENAAICFSKLLLGHTVRSLSVLQLTAMCGSWSQVMVRGTFANIRLVNKMCPTSGPKAVHLPSGDVLPVSDVAARYREEGAPMVILAGKEYGSGSSRDWAAK